MSSANTEVDAAAIDAWEAMQVGGPGDAERDALRNDRDALLKALRAVEDNALPGRICTMCAERVDMRGVGHDPECIIGRALARPR